MEERTRPLNGVERDAWSGLLTSTPLSQRYLWDDYVGTVVFCRDNSRFYL